MSKGPIVVGTDGESRANVAVDKAGELGQALGVDVHVVCAPAHLGGQDWPPRITAQQIVADAEERLRSRGVGVQSHIPVGDAALAVAAVADQVQAQMIVMGNRGMTGLGRFLGSLPNNVSHEARCNVLIVPTQARELEDFSGRSIVVGTDGSGEAMQVVREAIRLAKGLGGELHIVSTSKTSDPTLDAAAGEASEQGVSATTHTPDEEAADAIRGVAQRHGAAVIVLGGKGMHAEDRQRFGNVADKLSHDGSFSVLIVFTGGEGEAMSGVAAGTAESAGADAGQ